MQKTADAKVSRHKKRSKMMSRFKVNDVVRLTENVGDLKEGDEFVIIRVGLQNYAALDLGANECDLPCDKVELVLAGSDFSTAYREA